MEAGTKCIKWDGKQLADPGLSGWGEEPEARALHGGESERLPSITVRPQGTPPAAPGEAGVNLSTPPLQRMQENRTEADLMLNRTGLGAGARPWGL